MIVTIDGTDLLYGERAVRRHVMNLIRLAGAFDEGIDYRVFLSRFHAPGGEVPEPRPGLEVRSFRCPGRLFQLLSTRLGLLTVDRIAGRTDLYHAAGSNLFACRARHYLYTVGGFSTFVRPDLLPAAYVARMQGAFRSAFRRITHFVAVSETTRREVLERFPIEPGRVTAIPLGIDREFRPLDPAGCEGPLRERLGVRRPYALYVGGIQRNKNIALLLDAFARAARGALDRHTLVLVGPRPWPDAEIDAALARPDLAGRVVLAGQRSGEELVRLYAAADLFVFPTLYEGWTSPPLEAMACGIPVVASRASSVPETVGDAALLVDPLDAADVARGMERLVEDATLRAALRERGFARAAEFPWERCIGATVDLYRRLIAGG
jgi:alpha-1,3-rhamnosyl/mannosyltransferase